MISYWEKQSLLKKEIIIIGSGITGLSAAAYIKEKDPRIAVTVIEKGMIPSGASTKNAGFACFGSLSEIIDDLLNMPPQEVLDLVSMRVDGLKMLRDRLGSQNIDFQQLGGYELINKNDVHYLEKMDYINDLLSPIFGRRVFELRDDKIKSFGFSDQHVKHLIYTPLEGQIDTGKMMQQLLKYCGELGVEFINNLEVINIEDNSNSLKIHTKSNVTLIARKALVATNGFIKNLYPDSVIAPGRGQLFITRPIDELKFKGTFHMDRGYYYFRNFENRVIFGGGRNLDIAGETTMEDGINPKIFKELETLLKTIIFPTNKNNTIEIEHIWTGIMGFGPTKKVEIQKQSENVYAGVGLGGMGIAIGSIIGQKLAKKIF